MVYRRTGELDEVVHAVDQATQRLNETAPGKHSLVLNWQCIAQMIYTLVFSSVTFV